MSVLQNINGTFYRMDASDLVQLAAVDTEGILGGTPGATTDGQTLVDQLAEDVVQAQSDIGTLQSDKQPKTMSAPVSIDGTSQTTVEGAIGGLNTYADALDGGIDAIVNVYGAKNLLQVVSQTVSSVIFTVDDDGYITANASDGRSFDYASANVYMRLKAGTYFVKAFVKTAKTSWYTGFKIVDSQDNLIKDAGWDWSRFISTGVTFTIAQDTDIGIIYKVANGSYAFMLMDNRIKDNTYVKYAMTNADLTTGMLPRSEQRVLGAKNILDIEDKISKVINGITFTINADGTITANGTSTAQALLYLRQENYQVNEPLILSGNPAGAGDSTYSIYAKDTNGGYYYPYAPFATGDNEVFVPSGVTLDYVAIYIRGSKTVDNIVFKPMLRLASDSDNTYAPYAMTNRDLTNIIDRLMSMSGSGGGFAPIGTVIAYMGTTAPEDYLICDGATYNIADYKQLADFIKDQFGSYNFFGGNGTTTFAVPDLRGEFLRGTGTNSHTNQGSGANVGVHQDGTLHRTVGLNPNNDIAAIGRFPEQNLVDDGTDFWATVDAKNKASGDAYWDVHKEGTSAAGTSMQSFTSRPTNTSVLYCIKAVCAGDVYSTSERVVGTWIDGKPIYQKTAHTGAIPATGTYTIPFKNVETVIDEHLMMKKASGGFYFPVVVHASDSNYTAAPFSIDGTGTANDATMFITIGSAIDGNYGVSDSWLTLRYTKTTD